MTTSAMETRGLSKSFDEVRAVRDVSLSVSEGSVCGLVGPNGAGKSTLIGLLAGALRPTAGQALICGAPVLDNPAAKERVAWIPSDPFFFPAESLGGMADFYALAFPRFDRARFEALAASFELDPSSKLRKLSKGMRRQAAFWLTLSVRADVLLLDEPMDGLDPLVRRRMWQLVLGEVAGRGLSVLVSTHNLRELEGVCDRPAIMERGSLVRQLDLAGGGAGLVKVRVLLPEGAGLPEGLEVLHAEEEGRMRTLVVRGDPAAVRGRLEGASLLYLELVPLSPEGLFLYEVGGGSSVSRTLYDPVYAEVEAESVDAAERASLLAAVEQDVATSGAWCLADWDPDAYPVGSVELRPSTDRSLSLSLSEERTPATLAWARAFAAG